MVVIGMFCVSEVTAQEGGRSIPDLELVKDISITTRPTLWAGTVYANGAAKLAWGGPGTEPSDGNMAVAPKGSVSIKEAYNLLVPRLKPENDSGKVMYVFLRVADEVNRAWYLENTVENKEIAQTLLRKLCVKVVPENREKFEKLLHDYPFVSGGEPFPHVYSKKLDFAAFQTARESAFGEEERESSKKLSEDLQREKAERGQPAADEGGATATNVATASLPLTNETQRLEAATALHGRDAVRYLIIPSILCVGIILWLVRRKK